MRGAGRASGRSFRVPPTVNRREPDLEFPQVVPITDLAVAPVLEPINDDWSISNFDNPVDASDCSQYPASPFCDGNFLTLTPLGYEYEIKTNGCETCVYIYPVIAFFKAQPLIICKRDPNCRKSPPPPRRVQRTPEIPFIPEGYILGIRLKRGKHWQNGITDKITGGYDFFASPQPALLLDYYSTDTYFLGGYQIHEQVGVISEGNQYIGQLFTQQRVGASARTEGEAIAIFNQWFKITTGENNLAFVIHQDQADWADWYWGVNFVLIPIEGGVEIIPPPIIPPPPPPPEDREEMCCNDCAESADLNRLVLAEIKKLRSAVGEPVVKEGFVFGAPDLFSGVRDLVRDLKEALKNLAKVSGVIGTGKLDSALVDAAVGIGDRSLTGIVNLIAKRLGVNSYPIKVPNSLLEGYGDKEMSLQSNAEFLTWLTYQIDGFVGQFPVEIEIKDIDPLSEGDQTKKVTLPNVSEAIAEIYGLTMKTTVNQEVELNMLLRLAAEVIATKNAAVVTQDYARANANFLGYKANYKPRELTYNFDFIGANLDPKSKEPIILEKLLKTVTGYVQGWQLEDKETVVSFLQKLMFSAGIIKAVFFRGKGQQKELRREMETMAGDEKEQEKRFEQFIKEINDPNSRFNKDSQDKPQIKDETKLDPKNKG